MTEIWQVYPSMLTINEIPTYERSEDYNFASIIQKQFHYHIPNYYNVVNIICTLLHKM